MLRACYYLLSKIHVWSYGIVDLMQSQLQRGRVEETARGTNVTPENFAVEASARNRILTMTCEEQK